MPFVHRMQVRFADTDAQGHMYFANYLTFCDEALAAYMHDIGCPWQEMVTEGVDMFYRSSSCDYRSSAGFEAQIDIEAEIAKIGNSSVTSRFLMHSNGELLAEAELVSVCIDVKTREKTRVPERLRRAVARAS